MHNNDDIDTGNYADFFKENFRPLKVKDNPHYRIGRRTRKWLLEKKRKVGFNHLTESKLKRIVEDNALKTFEFDDHNIYVVNPDVEREIMVKFYQEKESDGNSGNIGIKDSVPVTNDVLLDGYRISAVAVELLTGDSLEDMELDPDSVVDFITCEMIVEALEGETLKICQDEEGVCTVAGAQEALTEVESVKLYLSKPLPGTEVSISELDLKERTVISGLYRDEVVGTGHDFSNRIQKIKE